MTIHDVLTEPSSSSRQQVRVAHAFLLHHAFYPLLLATMLGFAFLLARIYFTRNLYFVFLVKNLFLAWIPYWLSLAAVRLAESRSRQHVLIAGVWLAWLAMLPNAPYIVTDFVHIWRAPRFVWWYDVGMILMFALNGCFLGIVSLRIMHDLVRPKLGAAGGWLFVLCATTLSGYGIYIGRFHRWNSWDLLTHPHRILAQAFERVVNPLSHPRTVGVTLMFGAMMLVMYLMVNAMGPRAARES